MILIEQIIKVLILLILLGINMNKEKMAEAQPKTTISVSDDDLWTFSQTGGHMDNIFKFKMGEEMEYEFKGTKRKVSKIREN